MGFKDSKNSQLPDPRRHGQDRAGQVDNKTALKKTGVGLLLLVVGFMGAMSQLFSAQFNTQLESFNIKLAELTGTAYDGAPLCSGHGIAISNAKCLCDLGFAGVSCSEAVSTELTDPISNTILIVTDQFGSVNPENDLEADSSYALAMHLKEAGYSVTVLYVGYEEPPMFWKFQRDLLKQGVTLARLSSHGLNYGKNPVEGRSYDVYQYIIRQPEQFAIVHFDAYSGSGYYTLLAQKQGLICSKTKFLVGVNRLAPGEMTKLEKNDPEYLVTDVNTLKADYISKKTVEMADTVVVSSKILLKSLQDNSWEFDTSATHVIDMIPSTSVSGPGSKSVKTKEIAFVGSFSTVDGIKIFCESIENIASKLGKAHIKVSFVGIPKTIDDVPSEEWIDIYASNWDEYGLKWDVVKAKDSSEVLTYLAEKQGRVAILPSLFDPSAVIGQELLFGGFPFVASTESAVKDMIVAEDRHSVLVAPTVEELSRRLRDLIAAPAVAPRAVGFRSSSIESWLDLHSQVLSDDAPTCVHRFEDSKEYPLVSVVLVHHNRGHFLKQAVASIEAQTYPNIEVVLVDDGSTDKVSLEMLDTITWGWWENKGWKVIREKNKYLGAARNTGVKHAVGKYIVFMDDDDIAKPHQVETLVKVAINSNAEIVTSGHDVFTGKYTPFTAKSQKRYLPIGGAILPGMLENVFGDSKMLVARDTFVASGGFTEDFGVGFEDYEFLAKMALDGKNIQAVSEPLNWYRRHDEAMSYQTNLKANQLRMLRAYVDANEKAPRDQKRLLEHTQEVFFNRHGVHAFGLERRDRGGRNVTNSQPPRSHSSPPRPSGSPRPSDKPPRPSQSQPSRPPPSRTPRPSEKPSSRPPRPSASIRPSLSSRPSQSRSRPPPSGSPSRTLIRPTFTPLPPKSFIRSIESSRFESETVSFVSVRTMGYSATQTAASEVPVETSEPVDPNEPPPRIECGLLADCSGRCPGQSGFGYNYDCTGACVPSDNFKEYDQCYVCGGDGQSCVDCYGVVKGTAVEDLCGVCDGTGSTCNLYVANEPRIIPNEAGVNFTVVGAGFNNNLEDPVNNTYVFIDGEEVPRERLTFVQQQFIVVSFPEAVELTSDVDKFMVEVRQSGQDFELRELYMYDPSTSRVDSIEPDRIDVRQTGTVVLSGAFLDFPDTVCVIDDGSLYGKIAAATLGEVNGTTTLTCDTPLIYRDGFAGVHVLYSSPVWRTPYFSKKDNLREPYYLDESVPIGLYVFDTPPDLNFANFADSGESVHVYFRQDIFVIDSDVYEDSDELVIKPLNFGDVVSCSKVFSPNNNTLYTNSEDCTLTMPATNELKLSFAFGSTFIVPGDFLIFKENSVVKRGCTYCHDLEGKAMLYAPYNPQKPTVIVNGPTIIGPCPDLTLDLSQVSGSMGRPWRDVSITLFTRTSAGDTAQLEQYLETLASEAVGGSTSLVIPAEFLPLGDFLFSITYKNYLQGTGIGGLEVVKQETEIPYVILSSDNGFQGLFVKNIQTLRARALLACESTKSQDVVFTWSDSRGFVEPHMVSLSVLTFPKYTFHPNDTYTFNLQYGYIGQDTVEVQYSFRTQEKDKITANTGPSRTVGEDNIVKVKPFITSDAYSEIDHTIFSASYLCSTFPKHGECYSKETGEIIDLGSLASGFDLTGQIEAGQGYLISGIFTNEMTGSVGWGTPALLKVKEGTVPIIEMYPSSLNPGYLETFSAETWIQSESLNDDSVLKYEWSTPSYCAGRHLNDFELKETDLSTAREGNNLKFKLGVLQPDSTYCIDVKVTDESTGAYGAASVIVSIKNVPGGGTCFPQGGSVGVAFVDQFTVQCIGWSGESLPLKYEYSIKPDDGSPDDKGWMVLKPAGPSSSFTSYLPEGFWKVLTSVYDSTASVNLDLPIVALEVQSRSLSKRDARQDEVNFMTQRSEDFSHTLDLEAALGSLGVGAAALPYDVTQTYLSLQQQMIEFSRLLLNTGNWYLDQSIAAPFAATLLRALVGEIYELPIDSSEGVFDLLRSISTQLLYNEPTTCYSSEIAADFFDVIDGVLGSLNNTDTFSSEIAASLSYTVGEIRECFANELLCGEEPFEYEGRGLELAIGIADPNQIEEVCQFKVVNFFESAKPTPEGCVKIMCAEATLYGVVPQFIANNHAAMSRRVSSLSFFEEYYSIEIEDGEVYGSIKDESLGAFYPMEDFFNGQYGGFKPEISKLLIHEGDFNNVTLDDANVTITSVEDGIYNFKASSSGTFVLFAQFNDEPEAPPRPKPTTTTAPPVPSETPQPVVCPGLENCANLCPGDPAYLNFEIDDCGNCNLLSEPTKRDECGVCGGDGSSCKDCAGVVNGDNFIDICGVCVAPGIIPDCFVLAGIEPVIAPNTAGTEVTLYGSGYTEDGSVTLEVNGVNLTAGSFSVTGTQFITFTIDTPFSAAGQDGVGSVQFRLYKENEPPTKLRSLFYYDPNQTFFTDVFHEKKVFVNMVDTIIIHGANIVDTHNIIIDDVPLQPACVVRTSTEGILSGDMHIDPSGTEATCIAEFTQDGLAHVEGLFARPRFPTPKYPDITFLDRPEYFIPTQQPLEFKVYQHAPEVVQAQFDESGAAIFMDFDKPISVVGDTQLYVTTQEIVPLDFTTSAADCSSVFENSFETDRELWRDGFESDCLLSKVGPARLRLAFKGQFTLDPNSSPIVPGKNLDIKQNAVVSAGAIFSDATIGSQLVLPPSIAPLPYVDIKAPTLIGGCHNYEMDLSASYGSAGRRWKDIIIEFTPLAGAVDPAFVSMIRGNLTEQIPHVIAGNAHEIILQREALPANLYQWSVTFVNFLGGSHTSFANVEKSDAMDIPYIVMSSDNGLVDLDVAHLQILRARSIPIEGCGVSGKVHFRWSNSGVSSKKLLTSSSPAIVEFSEDVATKAALVATEYTFAPNVQYNFEVDAGFESSDNVYKFSMQIVTKRDVIFSNAGASRTVGTLNTVLMSANIINNAYRTFDESIYSCEWKCFSVNPDNSVGNNCISASTGLELTESMNGCKNVDISGHLVPGNFKFSVLVTNTETKSFNEGDPSHLKVLEGTVPLVHVEPTELSPGSFSDTFSLLAEVDPDTIQVAPRDMQYQWESMEECHGVHYIKTGLEHGVTTQTSPTARNLKFVPGALNPGTAYCFKLTAVDPQNPTSPGESSIIVSVRVAPFGGICKTPENTGSAFSTFYSFQCTGWVTDSLSYPLNFLFYIRRIGAQKWNLIGARSASSKFVTRMALGEYEVYPVVVDSAHSQNQEEQQFNISVSEAVRPNKLRKRQTISYATELAIGILAKALETLINTQDPISAASTVAMVIVGLPSDLTSLDGKELLAAILDFMKKLLASKFWYLDTTRQGPYLASLLASSTNGATNLATTESQQLFELAETGVSEISNNAPTSCYNFEAAINFLRALESSVASISTSQEFSSIISSKISTLVGTMETCLYNKLICGQSPFSFDQGGDVQLEVQIADTDLAQTTQIGTDVSLVGFAGGCVRTAIRQQSSVLLKTNIVDSLTDAEGVLGTIITVAVRDSSNNDIALPTDAKLNSCIAQKLTELQNLGFSAGWSSASDNGAKVLVGGEFVTPNNVLSDASLSTSNVQLVSGTQGANAETWNLCLESADIGSFGVVVKKGEVTTTPDTPDPVPDTPTTPGEEPSGASGPPMGIIGGAAGAVVLIVVVAGAVVFMKKKKAKQQQAKVSPSAPPAEVAVANGDAVIIQMNPDQITPVAIPAEDAGVVRTRDPAALPKYQLPPSYDEYMVARDDGRDLGPEDGPGNDVSGGDAIDVPANEGGASRQPSNLVDDEPAAEAFEEQPLENVDQEDTPGQEGDEYNY